MLHTARLLLVVALAILALYAANPVAAQEDQAATDTIAADSLSADSLAVSADSAAAAADTIPVDRARAMLASMSALVDSIYALDAAVREAGGADIELARIQAVRQVDRISALEEELIELIPSLAVEGPVADSIAEELGAFLSREAEMYDTAIDRNLDAIRNLRDRRAVTPPDSLDDLEAEMRRYKARLDSVLVRRMEVLDAADEIGVDTEAEWEQVDLWLRNQAETLVGRLQIAVVSRDQLRRRLRDAQRASAPESEVASLRLRLQAAEDRISGSAASLTSTANLLARRGIDTDQYRQALIRSTGQVTGDILDPGVALGVLRDWLGSIWQWVKDNGLTLFVRFLIVIASIFVTRIAFRFAWWLFRIIGLVSLSQLMTGLVTRMTRPLGTIVGLAIGLWFVGVDATTLLAGLGVAGVIIGLALQDSMSNLAAGLFILTHRPYDVGDLVSAGGVVGKVQAMGLANTTITTLDNRRLFVPNRKIWSDIIENRTAEKIRRVEVTATVSYRDDLDRALEVLRNLLSECEQVLKDPPPDVFVTKLADSAIEVAVRPWTKSDDWWPFTQDLPRLIRNRFREEGIEIPFPVRELVHRDGGGGEPEIREDA
jgi:small conductance mechanosensitive channel